MKDDFIYIHPLDFHPESAMTGTLGMRTRATKDEKQVCGKKPILVQICTWQCEKDKNKNKDCCVAKRKHEQDLARWEKCVQDIRAYNLSVATSPENMPPSSDNYPQDKETEDVVDEKPDNKNDDKPKNTQRVQVKRPQMDIIGDENTKSNTKIIIFSVIVVLAILATFVGYLAFKKN